MSLTVDQLPTTPGSLAVDERGHRYACTSPLWCITRWVALTRWATRPLDPDELAALNPTIEYVAPAWFGHRAPEPRT